MLSFKGKKLSREVTLKSLFNIDGFGLEIGASHNPLLPKAKGFNVKTVDYASKTELFEKYSNIPGVDAHRIEEVDFVTNGKPLLEIIPNRNQFDFIIASHVIEHVPNLIEFIQSSAELLKDDGLLVLAVPDKRYCFDLIQPLSTTGSVLQANFEKRQRPSPGLIFDSIAYDVLREGQAGWEEDNKNEPTFNSTLEAAKNFFEFSSQSDNYVDVHVWRFVPSSFRLIIEDLFSLGSIPVREKQFVESASGEFYVTLSKQGEGPKFSRIDLAMRSMKEQSAPFETKNSQGRRE